MGGRRTDPIPLRRPSSRALIGDRVRVHLRSCTSKDSVERTPLLPLLASAFRIGPTEVLEGCSFVLSHLESPSSAFYHPPSSRRLGLRKISTDVHTSKISPPDGRRDCVRVHAVRDNTVRTAARLTLKPLVLTTTFVLADTHGSSSRLRGVNIRHNCIMIQTKTLLPEFLAFCGPIAELKKQAEVLLPRKDLPLVFKRISQKDRDAFIEKLCQVYWNININDREQHLLKLFGGFFKAIGQHHPLALLTDGLTRDDANAATSEGITDVSQGEYKGDRVFIRVFRAYSAENLEGAKGVRLRCERGRVALLILPRFC